MRIAALILCGFTLWAGPSEAILAGKNRAPLTFEPNRGQADSSVRYIARGDGFTLFLNEREAVLKGRGADAVRIRPVHAAKGGSLEGLEPTGGASNYFLGKGPSNWYTGIPHYARVRYKQVYEGIDLVFHASQRDVEYDFIVSPGVDPGRIELEFKGARSLHLTPSGDLSIDMKSYSILQHLPKLYQEDHVELAGEYVMRGRNRVAFRVGAYDRSKTLTIDPVLSYSSFLGGHGFQSANSVALDAQGNVYVAGQINGVPDFPTTPGSYKPSGTCCGFVTKLNPTLDAVIYSTYIIGANPGPIAVDSSGSAYITGSAYTSLPTTPGVFQPGSASPTTFDAFAIKLNPAGSALVYSTYIGGGGYDSGNAIAVDSSGNAYIGGQTGSDNFPILNAFWPHYAGGPSDGFGLKLNAAATALVYSTFYGDTGGDSVNAIAVDASGNVYLAGATQFCFRTTCYDSDAFVVKLDPTGYRVYVDFFFGNFQDSANAVAVDKDGAVYVAGSTQSYDFTISLDAFQLFYGGGNSDAWVGKIAPDGTPVYASFFGGQGDETASGMALDLNGNVVIGGVTTGSIRAKNALQPNPGGDRDGFIITAALQTGGPAGLLSATYLGGRDHDEIHGLAINGSGDIILSGNTSSADFPTTVHAVQRVFLEDPNVDSIVEAFVARISSPIGCSFTVSPSTQQIAPGGGLATFTVGATQGCAWDASTNLSWLSINSGASGTGGGTAGISAVANNTVSTRKGSATIAGQVVQITQGPGATCTWSIDPEMQSFPAAGGTGMATVTTLEGCVWTPTFTAPWITSNTPYGVRTATFMYTIAPNTGPARTGSLVIAGKSLLINQAGAFPCDFAFTPPSGSVPPGAGPGSFGVTASNQVCTWTAVSNTPWISITSGASGTGNGTVNYSVTATSFPNQRSGTLTVAGQTYTIAQTGQSVASKPGIFRQGFLWVLDANGNHLIDDGPSPGPNVFGFGGLAGDIPIYGDWNGDGRTKVGFVRGGNTWYLDYNGNHQFDGALGDKVYAFGGLPGDIPVVGDWTGDGKTKIGIFRGGVWILDLNGNGIEDPAEDAAAFAFGGFPGDVPVVGDWTGSGKSNVGVFRQGFLWVLDTNGNHTNGAVFPYGGFPGDRPVVGDWAGTGVTQVGIFRQGFLWALDANGNRAIDEDSTFIFAFGGFPGPPADVPVVGKW